MRLGWPAEALADYDHAIRLFPDLAATHVDRGMALKALDRLDDALASLDEAIKLDRA